MWATMGTESLQARRANSPPGQRTVGSSIHKITAALLPSTQKKKRTKIV